MCVLSWEGVENPFRKARGRSRRSVGEGAEVVVHGEVCLSGLCLVGSAGPEWEVESWGAQAVLWTKISWGDTFM